MPGAWGPRHSLRQGAVLQSGELGLALTLKGLPGGGGMMLTAGAAEASDRHGRHSLTPQVGRPGREHPPGPARGLWRRGCWEGAAAPLRSAHRAESWWRGCC